MTLLSEAQLAEQIEDLECDLRAARAYEKQLIGENKALREDKLRLLGENIQLRGKLVGRNANKKNKLDVL